MGLFCGLVARVHESAIINRSTRESSPVLAALWILHCLCKRAWENGSQKGEGEVTRFRSERCREDFVCSVGMAVYLKREREREKTVHLITFWNSLEFVLFYF